MVTPRGTTDATLLISSFELLIIYENEMSTYLLVHQWFVEWVEKW